MNIDRCACPHCQQSLEYPTELASHVIECPTCQGQMTLPARQEAKGFFSSLADKFREARASYANKDRLKALLMDVVGDGILTEDEISQVQACFAETGLTAADIAKWRLDLFERAMSAIETRGFTNGSLEGLKTIQKFLCIHNIEIPEQRDKIKRWSYLCSIRDGVIPTVDNVENVLLRKGEKVFWVQPATLYEEKVVSRRYEGVSRGTSIRIMKGVSFRVGAHRGKLVTDTADVPITSGNFIVTSGRFIFQGDSKSFETKYEDLIDIKNHIDGIFYSEKSKQKQRKIQYSQANGDIIVEILTQVFSSSGKPN